MEGFWELHLAVDEAGRPRGVEAWLLLQEELSAFDPWRAWALSGSTPPACTGGLDAWPGALLLWADAGLQLSDAQVSGALSARPLLSAPPAWILAFPHEEGWALSAIDPAAMQLDAREAGLSALTLRAAELSVAVQLDPAQAARLALGASLGAAARLCGAAAAALSALRAYCGAHARFGRSLLHQQALAFELAEADTELYAARLMLHRLGAQLDLGARVPIELLARAQRAAQAVATRATRLDARVQAAAALSPSSPSFLRRAQVYGLLSAGLSPGAVSALSLGALQEAALGGLVV